MSHRHHPLFLGPHATKLRGTWVRSKRTGREGYIVHIERYRNLHILEGEPDDPETANEPILWIVFPPDPAQKEAGGKTWVAAGATASEVKKLKGWPNYFEEEE